MSMLHDEEIYEILVLARKNQHERREEFRLIHRILSHLGVPFTASIANRFSGENPMNDVLVLNVGQSSIDTITPLLTDGVTPSGGVVSAVSVSFTDPSASFVINPDNTITFTGVAPTAGGSPASGTTVCTVTDTDGAVAQFSQGFTVLVNSVTPPPPPTQLTQSIVNLFSTPQ